MTMSPSAHELARHSSPYERTHASEQRKSHQLRRVSRHCRFVPDAKADGRFIDAQSRLRSDGQHDGPSTAAGIGNLAAAEVFKFRHYDGANQLGNLHSPAYSDYTGYTPLNTCTWPRLACLSIMIRCIPTWLTWNPMTSRDLCDFWRTALSSGILLVEISACS